MKRRLDKLLVAARSDRGVYLSLLQNPQGTALAADMRLGSNDLNALHGIAAAIRLSAREHDQRQREEGKWCLLFPVMASVPSKRKRKAPKPPSPRTPRKPF